MYVGCVVCVCMDTAHGYRTCRWLPTEGMSATISDSFKPISLRWEAGPMPLTIRIWGEPMAPAERITSPITSPAPPPTPPPAAVLVGAVLHLATATLPVFSWISTPMTLRYRKRGREREREGERERERENERECSEEWEEKGESEHTLKHSEHRRKRVPPLLSLSE